MYLGQVSELQMPIFKDKARLRGGRASRRGSTGSIGSIARKGPPSASGGPAARPQGPGRWTSFTTSSPTDGACASSRQTLRVCADIVDDVTKECLGAIPDTSISGRRVARELTAIVERRGKLAMIVSDHGTEFTCTVMLAWSKETAIDCQLRRSSVAPPAPLGVQNPGTLTAAG
jgi:transposase InsO family protein